MTIRTGTVYKIQDLQAFRSQLDADWTEMAEALPEKKQKAIVMYENAHPDRTVSDVSDLDADALSEHLTANLSMNQLIMGTLEARDHEYTHVVEGHVHRIIELDP